MRYRAQDEVVRKKEQDLRTLYIRFGKREGEGKEAKLPTTGRQGQKSIEGNPSWILITTLATLHTL